MFLVWIEYMYIYTYMYMYFEPDVRHLCNVHVLVLFLLNDWLVLACSCTTTVILCISPSLSFSFVSFRSCCSLTVLICYPTLTRWLKSRVLKREKRNTRRLVPGYSVSLVTSSKTSLSQRTLPLIFSIPKAHSEGTCIRFICLERKTRQNACHNTCSHLM